MRQYLFWRSSPSRCSPLSLSLTAMLFVRRCLLSPRSCVSCIPRPTVLSKMQSVTGSSLPRSTWPLWMTGSGGLGLLLTTGPREKKNVYQIGERLAQKHESNYMTAFLFSTHVLTVQLRTSSTCTCSWKG